MQRPALISLLVASGLLVGGGLWWFSTDQAHAIDPIDSGTESNPDPKSAAVAGQKKTHSSQETEGPVATKASGPSLAQSDKSLMKNDLPEDLEPQAGTIAPIKAKDPTEASEALADQEAERIGKTPAIDPSKPGAASVIEALQTGNHPERLSIAQPPAPFDPEAFAQNPEAYTQVIEPARVFQTAQPSVEVPALTALVNRTQRMVLGEELVLAVRSKPGAPVSFTSLDLGIFAENGLTAITVIADDQGMAQVHLQATPGTVGEVRTLVGSPMASGMIKFETTIELPNEGG